MKKRIVYRPVCWCGCEKKLITVKRGGGDVYFCKEHAPAWMGIANMPVTKNGGKKAG